MTENEIFLPMPLEHSRNIFGQFDKYAKKLERAFQVSIVNRDEGIKVIGSEPSVRKADKVLRELWELSRRGNQIQGWRSLAGYSPWGCRVGHD